MSPAPASEGGVSALAWSPGFPSRPGWYWHLAVMGPASREPDDREPRLVEVREMRHSDFYSGASPVLTTLRPALVLVANSVREWDLWAGPIQPPDVPHPSPRAPGSGGVK